MTERETWQWQEPGSAWRGVGVYHITQTVPSREPLLGALVISDDDPSKAHKDNDKAVMEAYGMNPHVFTEDYSNSILLNLYNNIIYGN